VFNSTQMCVSQYTDFPDQKLMLSRNSTLGSQVAAGAFRNTLQFVLPPSCLHAGPWSDPSTLSLSSPSPGLQCCPALFTTPVSASPRFPECRAAAAATAAAIFIPSARWRRSSSRRGGGRCHGRGVRRGTRHLEVVRE
jgi:hypothetical protein